VDVLSRRLARSDSVVLQMKHNDQDATRRRDGDVFSLG